MNDTPQTNAAAYTSRIPVPTVEGGVYEFVRAEFARQLERELTTIRNERDELKLQVDQFQQTCDHEWEKCDDSFSHEFGIEIIRYLRCERCGKIAEWSDLPDEDDEPRIARDELDAP